MKNLKKSTNKMSFDIQLFADEADNDVTEESDVTVTNAAVGEDDVVFTDTSEKDITVNKEDITQTKSFAKRLKEETLKISQEKEMLTQKKLDETAVKRGFKNWEELETYTQNETLKESGIENPEAFSSILNSAIEKNPVVAEAKRIIEEQKQKEYNEFLTESVKEIHELDSDINTIDDVLRSEKYPELLKLVQQGYSLPNAYKVVEFDKILTKQNGKVAQQVKNNLNNKNHMKPIDGNSSKDVVIPEDVLRMYKINTKMTDQEIKEHYTKFIGGNNE